MKTLDQIRASYAWERVGKEGRGTKEYRNLAKGLPALVMTNGLLQALAFLKSKTRPDKKNKSNEHDLLFQDVGDWLRHEEVGLLPMEKRDWETVITRLVDLEPAEYRRATEEALAILKWIRQFADARAEEK